MKCNIVNPTRARIEFEEGELISVEKQLSYTNTSIAFQIKKHKENRWWRNKDFGTWQDKLDELQNSLKGCAMFHENGDYYVRPGSIPYISGNIETISNQIEYPGFMPIPWYSKPKFDPYPYQSQAVAALLRIRHGNISLPTGTGKSFILLLLARGMGLNSVIVTPSKSIFNELLTEFQKRLGKRYVGGYGDGKKDIKKKITIAIGKSLTMLKPGSEAYGFFKNKQAMYVDESHTFAASQLEDVCHGVLSDIPYRMFVSATQTRNDGTEKMLQSIIGQNVLHMELSEAIEQGYLCPLNFNILTTFSKSAKEIKDPMKCKREHFLYNKNIAEISAKIANASWLVKQESTLILVEELRQISMIKDLLTVPFAYVHSGSKKDAAKWDLHTVKLQDEVDRFNNGDVKVLIGTRAIATGTNMYPIHNCINWVGGSSEIVTKQGPMGRSTRKLEISEFAHLHKPKPFARIFDFEIQAQSMLNNQLKKRINFYEEANGEIKYA